MDMHGANVRAETEKIRLVEEGAASGVLRLTTVFHIIIFRHHDDMRIVIKDKERTRRGEAVHDGHSDIHEYEIAVRHRIPGDSFRSVAGLVENDVIVGQQAAQHASHLRLIIHDENPHKMFRTHGVRSNQAEWADTVNTWFHPFSGPTGHPAETAGTEDSCVGGEMLFLLSIPDMRGSIITAPLAALSPW
jgi:hypothetical protein